MSRSTAHRPLRRRLSVTTALVAVAAVALGCQSKMDTAAFVGNSRISDHDLSKAMDESLADPQIKKVVDDSLHGDLATYRQVLLDTKVQHLLITEAASRLHVTAREADISEQLSLLAAQTGGNGGARALFARNGLTEKAGEEVIRDEVLLGEIGYATGAHRANDAELRATYQTNLAQYTTITLGAIEVPDQATADSVRAQLDSDPGSFADVAKSHPGSQTTPTPQQVPAANASPELLSQLGKVSPGKSIVFSQPGLFVVIQLVKRDVVPFESVRGQLESSSLSAAESAGAPYLVKLAKQVRVRVNPRYGTWDYDKNQVAELHDPLLKLRPSAPPAPAAPGQGGAGGAGGQDGTGAGPTN